MDDWKSTRWQVTRQVWISGIVLGAFTGLLVTMVRRWSGTDVAWTAAPHLAAAWQSLASLHIPTAEMCLTFTTPFGAMLVFGVAFAVLLTIVNVQAAAGFAPAQQALRGRRAPAPTPVSSAVGPDETSQKVAPPETPRRVTPAAPDLVNATQPATSPGVSASPGKRSMPAATVQATVPAAPPPPLAAAETSRAWVSSGNDTRHVADEWQVGDVVLDLYEVRGILGEGGMGRVYQVHHRGWNLDLAVKSPRLDCFETPAQQAAFIQEAETWVNLGLYPHTVACYYVRKLGRIPRVFIEQVDGGSLAQWIRDQRLYAGGEKTALARMLDIAIQFAWGLEFAQRAGLVHQDVKPANVLLTNDGLVKVTDFGLSKAFRGSPGRGAGPVDRLVSFGGMTPAYCSPEQAAGRALSPATDIWSWAVSLLEMFVGQVTWNSGTLAPAILQDYLTTRRKKSVIPPMPAELATLLQACLAESPASRPGGFTEVAQRLTRIYRSVVGRDYDRARPALVRDRSDALNNRGISLWDLDRQDDADACFSEALRLDASHPEATYNRCLMRWRSARQTDAELVGELTKLRGSLPDDPRPLYYLGLVHLERGDREQAVAALEAGQKLAASSASACVSANDFATALRATRENRRAWMEAAETLKWYWPSTHSMGVLAGDGERVALGLMKQSRVFRAADGATLHQFEGHQGHVTQILWARNDSWLIVADTEHVRIFDWAVKKVVWEAVVPRYNANANATRSGTIGRGALQCSPDGKRVLLVDVDGITGWDIDKNVVEFREAYRVTAAAPAGDGSCAVVLGVGTGPQRNAITTYCVSTWTAQEGPGAVLDVAVDRLGFHPQTVALEDDGQHVILSGVTRNHVASFARLHLGSGAIDWIREWTGVSRSFVAPCANSSYAIAVPHHDDNRHLWRVLDTRTGRCVYTRAEPDQRGHEAASIAPVAFFPDSRRILLLHSAAVRIRRIGEVRPQAVAVCLPSSHGAQTARAAEVRRQQAEAETQMARGSWAAAATAIDLARAVPGFARDNELLDLRWRLRTGARIVGLEDLGSVRTLRDDQSPDCGFKGVAFSPDGTQLVTADRSTTATTCYVRFFSPASGQVLRRCSNGRTFLDGRFSLANDGTVVAAPGGYLLWLPPSPSDVEPARGNITSENSAAAAAGGTRTLLGRSPRGFDFLVAGGRHLERWDVKSRRCRWSVPIVDAPNAYLSGVTWSPCERYALLYIRDGVAGSMQVRDAATGAGVHSMEIHRGGIPQWAPDGRSILIRDDAGSYFGGGPRGDWVIVGTEPRAPRVVGHAPAGTAQWTHQAWTPDSRYIVTGGRDPEIHIADAATGALIRSFPAGGRAIDGLDLSPDGRYVAWTTEGVLRIVELIWQFTFPAAADWDDAAQPHLETFLCQHTGDDQKVRVTQADIDQFLVRLGWAGFGWLRPEGVLRELHGRGKNWDGGVSCRPGFIAAAAN